MTFCELHTPCKNGGTCLDEGDDKYVCVCPKCNCSTTEPFDNCTLGRCILQAVLSCCFLTMSIKVFSCYTYISLYLNILSIRRFVCGTTSPG